MGGVGVAVGVVELDAPRDSVAVGDAVCEGDAEGLCTCGEVPAQKKASHKSTCGASESQSQEPERLSHQQA